MTRFIALLLLVLAVPIARPAHAQDQQDAFAAAVDLTPLGSIAVHQDGRLKSFDSFARSMMQLVTGPRRIDGQSDAFTYLDLIMRGERYTDRDIIYVKKKPIRARMLTALRASSEAQVPGFDAWADSFVDRGLIAPSRLATPPVVAVMSELNRDLVRTAKFVQMLETAMALTESRRLLNSWRVVPPANGDALAQWSSMIDIMNMDGTANLNGMDEATRQQVLTTWIRFVTAWRNEDAAGVNGAAVELAGVLPTVSPELYPSWNRLAWESWYFKMKNLVWVWLIYAFALVPLTLALLFRWRTAKWFGMGLFMGAFGLQTFAVILRWYVAQRWPNTNMFEAVTTACWFGGVAALVPGGLGPEDAHERAVRAVERRRVDGRVHGGPLLPAAPRPEHLQPHAGALRRVALHPHERDHLQLLPHLHGGGDGVHVHRLAAAREAQGLRREG